MKEINGDLIKLAKQGEFDIIAHGCNCFNTMGAGIAKQIKEEFKDAWIADQHTISGDINKLGTFTRVYYESKKLWVYNCYTQYRYGTDKIYLDYEALTLCMRKINHMNTIGRIGMPKIGCGLAGGDWNIVKKIMEKELELMNITIVSL